MPKKKSIQRGIFIEAGAKPDRYEIRCGFRMAEHFQSNIVFLKPGNTPRADCLVEKTNQIWEIKNIIGNGKNTIHHCLRNITHQSPYVIITLYRTKMKPSTAIGRAKAEIKNATRIKKLLLITKNEKIVVIK